MNTGQSVSIAITFCLCLVSAEIQAACKFEIDEPSATESKVFVIARGWNTGLSGHIGWNNGKYYLRGRYYSSYAATPSFDHRTPLELQFDDGSAIVLPVLEGAAGKLDFNPMLANNREAVPVFALDEQQLHKIQQSTISGVHLQRIDKQEVGSKRYKVSKRAARNISAAALCVDKRVSTR